MKKIIFVFALSSAFTLTQAQVPDSTNKKRKQPDSTNKENRKRKNPISPDSLQWYDSINKNKKPYMKDNKNLRDSTKNGKSEPPQKTKSRNTKDSTGYKKTHANNTNRQDTTKGKNRTTPPKK